MMRPLPACAALFLCAALGACVGPFENFSVLPPRETQRPPAIIDGNARLADAHAAPELVRVPLLEDPPRGSYELVKVTGKLAPHLHARSAETVYILRGGGDVLVDDAWHAVRAGMLVHLPIGVPHAFVNRDPEGTLVLSIFTPAYFEGDRVLLEESAP